MNSPHAARVTALWGNFCQVIYIISVKKIVLHHKYVWYLRIASIILFIILSAIKWAKLHLSNTIVTKVNILGYSIYSLTDLHCYRWGSAEVYLSISKKLVLPIMVLESLHLAHLMVERMVNTLVRDLLRYLRYSRLRERALLDVKLLPNQSWLLDSVRIQSLYGTIQLHPWYGIVEHRLDWWVEILSYDTTAGSCLLWGGRGGDAYHRGEY